MPKLTIDNREIEVPAGAYYGAQTERARRNFPVSGLTFPPRFIAASVFAGISDIRRAPLRLMLAPRSRARVPARRARAG